MTAAALGAPWPDLAALVLGYGLGSIPFGLILGRLAGLGDIRRLGSGNIGATNVLRTGRKGLAALTLLLDGAKGAAAVLLGALLGPEAGLIAGVAAVLGHLFPVWIGFAGGKGVATGIGVLLAICWPAGVAAAGTWILIAALFRYSSLAALVAFAAAPAYVLAFAEETRALVMALVSLLVIARHHGNIGRLFAGTEPHIGD